MRHIRFNWTVCSRHSWGTHSAPLKPLDGFKGHTTKGRGDKGKGGKKRREKRGGRRKGIEGPALDQAKIDATELPTNGMILT